MRRTAVLVALAVLVVMGTAAPLVALAQDSGGDTGAAARDLTLEDLAPGGQKPSNAPDSIRANGRFGEFAVKQLPTGLMVDESERSPSWRYLRSGQTINRNYLQLWSKRAYGADTQEYVVEVAHYRVGKEQYETADGGTAYRKAALNVTTYERSVTFSGGYDFAQIDLREHYDQKVRTVMCVRSPGEASCLANPGDTRWTFYHKSSKATLPVETNSAGARLGWGLLSLLLPFFGATVTTLYGGKKFVEKAKAGPQISALWWVLAAIGGVLFMVVGWNWVSARLIRAPWLVAAAGGILLGVIAVEWFGRRTYGVGFLQFKLAEGFDPTDPSDVERALENQDGDDETEDTDAPGILKASFTIARFARGDKGERSVIRKGIRKFWARARGATADFEADGNMQTKIDVDGPIEELYLLDPEDEEPMDYEPEHHAVEFPDLVTYDEDGNAQYHPVPYLMGGGALGFSWLTGQIAAGSGLLGLFVGGLLLFVTRIAKPREGRMFANLAPVHYHHAVATMLTHARGLADAKSWEDWFRNYAESEAESHADRKDLLDDRSESQLEELYQRYVGAGEADAPVRSQNGDGAGQEVTSDD